MAKVPDKAAPVRRTWADLLQRGDMLGSTISLITGKTVLRVLLVQLNQLAVS